MTPASAARRMLIESPTHKNGIEAAATQRCIHSGTLPMSMSRRMMLGIKYPRGCHERPVKPYTMAKSTANLSTASRHPATM